MKCLLLSASLTWVTVAASQNGPSAADHLSAFAERLARTTSYHVVAHVHVCDARTGKPLSTDRSEAYGSGNSFYSTIGERTTLINDRSYLLVDAGQKRMIHHARTGQSEASTQVPATTQRDMLATLAERTEGTRILREDEKSVTILVPGGAGYKSTEVTLSKPDRTLLKIVYFLDSSSRDLGAGQEVGKVEVAYSVFDLNARVPAERFDERRFIRTMVDGSRKAAPGYADFKLIFTGGQ